MSSFQNFEFIVPRELVSFLLFLSVVLTIFFFLCFLVVVVVLLFMFLVCCFMLSAIFPVFFTSINKISSLSGLSTGVVRFRISSFFLVVLLGLIASTTFGCLIRETHFLN